MLMDKVEFLKIEDIIESLPHKFRNGKNVKIIIDAYYKQYNKMIHTLIISAICFNVDNASGEQLDKIGSNFMVRRDNTNDDSYRDKIKLTFAIYKMSGNIYNISRVFRDYLNINIETLSVYESGRSSLILEINKNKNISGDVVNIINDVISFGKPVGVGFSIEPFSSTSIIDSYLQMQIESEIDRFNKRYMLSNRIMDNAYHMYSSYYMNIAVDRYLPSTIEII